MKTPIRNKFLQAQCSNIDLKEVPMGRNHGAGSKQVRLDALSSNPARLSDSNGSPCISVKSLWKVFGENPERVLTPENAGKDKGDILAELGCVVALQDVNFEVAEGEIFVVMGLSGSGKSTLVRCLIRLIEPTQGQILVDGEDILGYNAARLTQLRRNKVAMVFQKYGLLPHRRVIDNVIWGLEVQGVDKRERLERAQEILEMVGLKGWETSYPRMLSGGMQQRVGLARALAVNPEILLLDEPFSGLDPLIRRNMQDELIKLQAQLHKTMVFITHDLNEALKLGDRIAIMRDGEIVQLDTPEEIVMNPQGEYVTEFIRDVRRESVLKAKSVMKEPKTEGLDADGPSCDEDTTLEDLIPLLMQHQQPIQVRNEAGELVGEVHRSDVMLTMTQV
jgi:glycine betaine/proline transport system ATP-binding protein